MQQGLGFAAAAVQGLVPGDAQRLLRCAQAWGSVLALPLEPLRHFFQKEVGMGWWKKNIKQTTCFALCLVNGLSNL